VTSDTPSAVAQDFFQKCFRGHISSAVGLLDPEVTYRVPGSHELAGTFEGPSEVASHVEKLLRMTSTTVDVLQWEDWLIGVDNLAGLVRLRLHRHGTIETIRAIFLVTMSGDAKITRIETFFADQAKVERFFNVTA
jgi:ketosteroid isomerase-like protein